MDKTLSKKISNKWIKFGQKFAKLVTETNYKICKFKTYKKAVNNPINRNK